MLSVIIRGGGDLASGIAVRLHRVGVRVLITEIAKPLAVRRYVSFAEAVYTKQVEIEDITGVLVNTSMEIFECQKAGKIPVVIDEDLTRFPEIPVSIVVDARMLKMNIREPKRSGVLRIGIGPGFMPGENCDCVIESKRGPYLGRVYWHNAAEADSGAPEQVGEFIQERVLRSPRDGVFRANTRIGESIRKGEAIASIADEAILAPFDGIVRGLIHDGVEVFKGLKVGDIDPRNDPLLCSIVSDKALCIGGAVLEAILSQKEYRARLAEMEQEK